MGDMVPESTADDIMPWHAVDEFVRNEPAVIERAFADRPLPLI